MGSHPTKEELMQEIKNLEKKLSVSSEKAKEEQNRLQNEINQLLKQKIIQENKEKQNDINFQKQ